MPPDRLTPILVIPPRRSPCTTAANGASPCCRHCRLDIDRARRLLGGSRHLRLAGEAELAEAFPAFDVGALPPVGPMLPLPEVIDVRLLYRDRVVVPGGDHRHAIRLDPRELIQLSEQCVGDLCERDELSHHKRFAELPRV